MFLAFSCDSSESIGKGDSRTYESYIAAFVKCDCVSTQIFSGYTIDEENKLYYKRSGTEEGIGILISVDSYYPENNDNVFSYEYKGNRPYNPSLKYHVPYPVSFLWLHVLP